MKNLSPEIAFMSIGYSYADNFGQELLSKLDSYNYRDKKWIINIDPYPNEAALSYYTQKRICIIKCSFQDFFKLYREWERDNVDSLVKRKGLDVRSSKDSVLPISNKLLVNLDGVVRQLNRHSKEVFIKEVDFYKGQEPSFNLITRNADVIRIEYINKFKKTILENINMGNTLLPIFFILGDFGIGKSTFTLRLIYEMENDSSLDLIVFEILDFNNLRKEWLIGLINQVKSKNIIFFCDEIEVESYFKSLLEIRNDLSIEQFQNTNISFVVPIRENIYEKHKLTRPVNNVNELLLAGKFNAEEIEDLVEKLKNVGLITYRDASEKTALINKITKQYDSDSFVSLMSLINSGHHEADLISCYEQLSSEAKTAFLYTSLLHRYKLSMPAGWLKQLVAMDWDEFTQKVINAEGKGILIQELTASFGSVPDLYFKTKHSIIADKLVKKLIPSVDKLYGYYNNIVRTVEYSKQSSFLINDLLKALSKSDEFNKEQINKLYDSAYTMWSEEPYFLLNYSINLQHRNKIEDLKKALDILIYAESLLDAKNPYVVQRNHKFIHRRGVINFELAKKYYDRADSTHTYLYLREAKDLFNVKQILDPCSSFSYVDYIELLLWELTNCNEEDENNIGLQIKIEELFNIADETVTIGLERIDALKSAYAKYKSQISTNSDYKCYLDDLYGSDRLRPYVCILLYNYYLQDNNIEECETLIDEMENYLDNYEVVKFLYLYYGDYLYDPNIRIKQLQLAKTNSSLEKDMPFRYYFFNFMAESYDENFKDGRAFLQNIKKRSYYLNPMLHYIWQDSLGNDRIFGGIVVQNPYTKYKQIKIKENQQIISLIKGDYDDLSIGQKVNVKIHFYLRGLMAQIIGKQ